MHSRIQHRFSELRTARRAGLITFLTAGDPTPAATVPCMHALVRGGADLIELGIPFSDPMADGPIIQRASERALAAGMTLKKVLETVVEFRRDDRVTPVVLMGYLNPVEHWGYESFAEAAHEAGVDGVLLVDLPPEEGDELRQACLARGLDQVLLIAPNSTDERMASVCRAATGFVYYVSVKGVTGGKAVDTTEVKAKVAKLRMLTELPVGVGFGVRTPEQAAQIAGVCDAVIVGSALVEIVEKAGGDTARAATHLQQFVAGLRAAVGAAAAT
ncbi:MAG: tryptophan synthase subunit alpha [Gammaproteobacteria bacterium]|nr:tryptophan synthase subunit alpha [Gammaproteobacteria bacterium]